MRTNRNIVGAFLIVLDPSVQSDLPMVRPCRTKYDHACVWEKRATSTTKLGTEAEVLARGDEA